MVSLSDLKNWLGITGTDSARDAALTALEVRAVALIEKSSGRYFGPPLETTETRDGTGGVAFWLDEEPDMAQPFTLSVRCAVGDAWEVVDPDASDGYEVNGRQVIRKGSRVAYRDSGYPGIGCHWPRGRMTIKVTYTRGYTAGSEPQEAVDLVYTLVSAKWGMRGNEGLQGEKQGDYSWTAADLADIPEWKPRIASLRRGEMW